MSNFSPLPRLLPNHLVHHVKPPLPSSAKVRPSNHSVSLSLIALPTTRYPFYQYPQNTHFLHVMLTTDSRARAPRLTGQGRRPSLRLGGLFPLDPLDPLQRLPPGSIQPFDWSFRGFSHQPRQCFSSCRYSLRWRGPYSRFFCSRRRLVPSWNPSFSFWNPS